MGHVGCVQSVRRAAVRSGGPRGGRRGKRLSTSGPVHPEARPSRPASRWRGGRSDSPGGDTNSSSGVRPRVPLRYELIAPERQPLSFSSAASSRSRAPRRGRTQVALARRAGGGPASSGRWALARTLCGIGRNPTSRRASGSPARRARAPVGSGSGTRDLFRAVAAEEEGEGLGGSGRPISSRATRRRPGRDPSRRGKISPPG